MSARLDARRLPLAMRFDTRRLPLAAMAAIVTVAIIGYSAGHTHSTTVTRERLVTGSAGSVRFSYPASWQHATNAPQIPGLSIANMVALAPGGDGAKAGLVAGTLPPGEPSPLPRQFLEEIRQVPNTEVVNLVELQAYRYARLTVAGFNRPLVVFVVPNPEGNPTALACYSAAGSQTFLGTCQQIVATITLVGQSQLYDLTPDPGYARQLNASIAALDGQRLSLRREMGSRVAPSVVHRLAARLADAFSNASRSLSGLEPSTATSQAQASLSGAILGARNAYAALAQAAGAEDPQRFAAARGQVEEAEKKVDNALEGFAVLGFKQS